jgi:hypothetical protein
MQKPLEVHVAVDAAVACFHALIFDWLIITFQAFESDVLYINGRPLRIAARPRIVGQTSDRNDVA